MALNELAPGLWERNAPLSVLGMHLGHRMTVARLPAGELWVHSPVEYSPEVAEAVQRLGRIGHIVAPNYMHDTYLEGWLPKFPAARFHAPRAFHKVLPGFKVTDPLADTPPPAWSGVIDQHVVQGMPRLHEVVFFHRASRSLIIADLAFNLGPDMPVLSKALLKLNGCYCRFAPSRMVKGIIRDRAALRASIDRILQWDFTRIIVSHGRNLEDAPRDALRQAFAFLGNDPGRDAESPPAPDRAAGR
jgi:hypothetical protein